jgi:hypothetical protein
VIAAGALLADQGAPTKYTLTLDTRTMNMGFKIPNMPNMPNIPGLADLNKPQRIISGQANYPDKPQEPIFVTVPDDLALANNQLVLHVFKPAPAPGGNGGNAPQAQGPAKMKMKISVYWNPETAKGPIVNELDIDTSKFRGGGRGPGGPRPAPNAFDLGNFDIEKMASGAESKLPPKVVGQGQYTLNTGNITMPLNGFLPPIQVKTPESLADVNPADGIDVTWEPVAGAKGYILFANSVNMRGAAGEMEFTMWVSTTVEPPQRVRASYEQATTIDDDLKNGILLSPDTVSCKVPAGIFAPDKGTFNLQVIAVGQDYYDNQGGSTVVGKIRSTWQAMKMAGMGGMGMPAPPKPAQGDQDGAQ